MEGELLKSVLKGIKITSFSESHLCILLPAFPRRLNVAEAWRPSKGSWHKKGGSGREEARERMGERSKNSEFDRTGFSINMFPSSEQGVRSFQMLEWSYQVQPEWSPWMNCGYGTYRFFRLLLDMARTQPGWVVHRIVSTSFHHTHARNPLTSCFAAPPPYDANDPHDVTGRCFESASSRDRTRSQA